jgi:hypothetical protein
MGNKANQYLYIWRIPILPGTLTEAKHQKERRLFYYVFIKFLKPLESES